MSLFNRILPFLTLLITHHGVGYGQMIEVQGHRGCRGVLPENTLPAFAAAIDGGVDTLEMDLLITKDGAIIIHHDYALNGNLCCYSNGSPILDEILIRDLTLAQVKEIDYGSKRNPKFPSQKALPGTQIPTLEEVFSLVKIKNCRLNLEIKRSSENPEYTFSSEILAKKIVEAVRKNGLESHVYYSSFDFEVLAEIRKIDPTATIGLIKGGTLEGLLEAAINLKAQIVSPEHRLLKTTKDVEILHTADLRVIPWTVNDHERWQQLIEMNVDGIITDYPQDLNLFLDTTKDEKEAVMA